MLQGPQLQYSITTLRSPQTTLQLGARGILFWDRNPDCREEPGNTQKNTTRASGFFFRNCWELRNLRQPTLLSLCSAWLMLCSVHSGHLVLMDVSRRVQNHYRKSGIWNLGGSGWTGNLRAYVNFCFRLFLSHML